MPASPGHSYLRADVACRLSIARFADRVSSMRPATRGLTIHAANQTAVVRRLDLNRITVVLADRAQKRCTFELRARVGGPITRFLTSSLSALDLPRRGMHVRLSASSGVAQTFV